MLSVKPLYPVPRSLALPPPRRSGPRERKAAPARPAAPAWGLRATRPGCGLPAPGKPPRHSPGQPHPARRPPAPAPLTCFSPEVTGRAFPLALALTAPLRAMLKTLAAFADRDRLFPMAAAAATDVTPARRRGLQSPPALSSGGGAARGRQGALRPPAAGGDTAGGAGDGGRDMDDKISPDPNFAVFKCKFFRRCVIIV